jgi:hypothetical protein|tara:strand:- start:6574 stop:6771 length:198 start_codon:yes stop_codon:yes gene_type:complete
MKVKMFSKCGRYFGKSNIAASLEGEINVWLESEPEIKVVDIKQTSCGGSLEPGQHLISVWYEIVA